MNMDRYKDLLPFSRDELLNNFSYWYPKVKDCGLPVPKSCIIQIPDDLADRGVFYMENIPESQKAVDQFVTGKVFPALEESGIKTAHLFVKNGAFSNKFDAEKGCLCLYDKYDLVRSILNIQYNSAMFETGGEKEIVIRERIGYNSELIPCIYHGLPLRPEFRVFYDFDIHEVLFVANYWDYDYCRDHIMDATDKIVFDKMKDYLYCAFERWKDDVADKVSQCMKNVTDLSGPWSVDIMMTNYPENIQRRMMEDIGNKYSTVQHPVGYLIDMAVAERSAYWDQRPQKDE